MFKIDHNSYVILIFIDYYLHSLYFLRINTLNFICYFEKRKENASEINNFNEFDTNLNRTMTRRDLIVSGKQKQ